MPKPRKGKEGVCIGPITKPVNGEEYQLIRIALRCHPSVIRDLRRVQQVIINEGGPPTFDPEYLIGMLLYVFLNISPEEREHSIRTMQATILMLQERFATEDAYDNADSINGQTTISDEIVRQLNNPNAERN